MIRSEAEYQKVRERLELEREALRRQAEELEATGLRSDAVARAMEPLVSFHEQLKEEAATYEAMRRGDLGTIRNLETIGRWLIGARIARGWTQRQLAEELSVSEAQISRDERNEYHGITVERAQRLLEVLDVAFVMAEDQTAVAPRKVRPPLRSGRRASDAVAAFLRADPKLDKEKASRLASRFEALYESEVDALEPSDVK